MACDPLHTKSELPSYKAQKLHKLSYQKLDSKFLSLAACPLAAYRQASQYREPEQRMLPKKPSLQVTHFLQLAPCGPGAGPHTLQ